MFPPQVLEFHFRLLAQLLALVLHLFFVLLLGCCFAEPSDEFSSPSLPVGGGSVAAWVCWACYRSFDELGRARPFVSVLVLVFAFCASYSADCRGGGFRP